MRTISSLKTKEIEYEFGLGAVKKHAFIENSVANIRNVTPGADVKNQGELERECVSGKMVRTGDSKTGFLATWNGLCIDAPALVTANIAVELGVANGREVIIREVTPELN